MKKYIFLSMVALLISGCNLTPEEYNQFKYSLAISQVQSTCPNDTRSLMFMANLCVEASIQQSSIIEAIIIPANLTSVLVIPRELVLSQTDFK